MSGGSFDYLFMKIEDEPLGWLVFEELKEMIDWLSENNERDAADELKGLYAYLTDIRDKINSKLTPQLLDVMRGTEWWCSGDTDQNSFKIVWQNYCESKSHTTSAMMTAESEESSNA